MHNQLKKKGKRKDKEEQTSIQFHSEKETEANELLADLAWHVRAWGQWVLGRARKELARYYPTCADFEPFKKDQIAYEPQPMRLVPSKKDGSGVADIDMLNAEFTADYLADKRNPRWVSKPTVAYLWARTVICKNCRATVPLLKTRWLCKKPDKRVLLTMEPSADRAGVVFGIDPNVAAKGGNAAQKREHDKRLAGGTMSRAGAQCPCCNAINTMQDIRLESKAGRLGSIMTAVVVDSPGGKDYRLPTEHEREVATPGEDRVQAAFKDVPFGVPDEPTPSAEALGMRVPLYGFDQWRKLFTARQLTALGTFVAASRAAREDMADQQVAAEWIEAVGAYLALAVDRVANRASCLCIWNMPAEKIEQTFARFALPIMWDYAESSPLADASGSLASEIEWVSLVARHISIATLDASSPTVQNQSAKTGHFNDVDLVVTDPPYYDAIPYSDLMDFFYIWLRRSSVGMSSSIDSVVGNRRLSPK